MTSSIRNIRCSSLSPRYKKIETIQIVCENEYSWSKSMYHGSHSTNFSMWTEVCFFYGESHSFRPAFETLPAGCARLLSFRWRQARKICTRKWQCCSWKVTSDLRFCASYCDIWFLDVCQMSAVLSLHGDYDMNCKTTSTDVAFPILMLDLWL